MLLYNGRLHTGRWNHSLKLAVKYDRRELLALMLEDPDIGSHPRQNWINPHFDVIHEAIRYNRIECYEMIRAEESNCTIENALFYVNQARERNQLEILEHIVNAMNLKDSYRIFSTWLSLE
jgi:hypothetical protein